MDNSVPDLMECPNCKNIINFNTYNIKGGFYEIMKTETKCEYFCRKCLTHIRTLVYDNTENLKYEWRLTVDA